LLKASFSCRALAVAYGKAQQTMANPCYNSDGEDEDDDQALHDLRGSLRDCRDRWAVLTGESTHLTGIEIAVLRDSQRINGHLPRSKPTETIIEPAVVIDAPPPTFEPVSDSAQPSGTIPKLKLTFGGGKKASLSALLN
jgi:hypothetical protein